MRKVGGSKASLDGILETTELVVNRFRFIGGHTLIMSPMIARGSVVLTNNNCFLHVIPVSCVSSLY